MPIYRDGSGALFALTNMRSATQADPCDGLEALPAQPDRSPMPIAALYREYFQFVWRSLRRLGVHESSVDDAVQDVFLVAHRKLDEFERRSSYKVWLFGIALRVASEHRRRDRRLQLDAQAVANAIARNDHAIEMRRRIEVLDALLDTLDDRQRAVFVMAEIEGFSAPEIAEVLAIKLNTVYSRLRLGRHSFEKALERYRRSHGPRSLL